jgi:hypothetical protein
MIWRVGRRVGRTVYEQQAWEPQDGDQLIGVMDTRELAEKVVQAVNDGQLNKGFGYEFKAELQDMIHAHGIDTKLNTADFILADYVIDTLWNLGPMLAARKNWESVPKPDAH